MSLLKFLLQLLRSQFSEFDDYRWRKDENETDIIIDLADINDKRLETEKRALWLKRGNVSISKTGLDNAKSLTLSNGKEEFASTKSGNLVIMCASKNLLEVEEMSDLVSHMAESWASKIRLFLGLDSFNVSNNGEPGVSDDVVGSYIIPIIIQYSYKDCWTLQLQTVKLEDIKITTNIE